MGRLVLTRTIAAPPEEVFVFFVPQRMPYWYGAEMDSCFEVQDGAADFAVGLKVRISGRLGKKSVTHTAVVTEFKYARLLEWRFQDAYGVRGKERWELEPVPGGPDLSGKDSGKKEGQTLLRFINQYELPGRLGPAVDWLLTRHALAQRNREYVARLARLAERMG
jgi:uncharacterized protein YndB with AHSA1/START domain